MFADDLNTVILEDLYKLYNIEEDDKSMNLLYHYLHIRAGLVFKNKNVSDLQIITFIFKELNVDIFEGIYIYYDGIKYNVNRVGSAFLEDLEFRANFEGEVDLKIIEKLIYSEGYKKATRFKKSKYYKQHILYNRLLELNKYFRVNPQAKYNNLFKKSLSHNPYKRTLEEEILAIIDSEKIASHNTQYIDERTFEDYMIENLFLLEEDLIYQGRQVKVSGGIIDILAKDKDDNIVIIELKVTDDKSIIWQSLHYPKVISQMNNIDINKIRMITLSPTYKKSIYERLEEINNIEIYKYNITVSLGKIEKLNITRLN